MGALDVVPQYLLGPLVGLAGYGLVLVSVSGRGNRSEESLLGRKLVLFAIPATPTAYGLALLILALPLARDPQHVPILQQIGVAFSLVALGAIIGQTYQISRAVPAMERRPELFPRNMVLQVIPDVAFLFGFVGSFLAIRAIAAGVPLDLGTSLFAGPLLWFSLIGAGGLLSGLLAGAVNDPEEFAPHLLRGMAGSFVTVLGFSLFLFSLPT